MGAAAAQERAQEVAAAGAAWGAEASGLLGFWVWGRCFLRFSTAAGLSTYGCAVHRELVLLYDIYLALMCARYMLALTSATRVCSHVCRAVCYLPAVCCFRPPGVGVCGHAVRVAFLLSHGPHARFRVLKFLTRPTRGPRTPRRGCVATRFFFPDDHLFINLRYLQASLSS
jgi:hypothetical protein